MGYSVSSGWVGMKGLDPPPLKTRISHQEQCTTKSTSVELISCSTSASSCTVRAWCAGNSRDPNYFPAVTRFTAIWRVSWESSNRFRKSGHTSLYT